MCPARSPLVAACLLSLSVVGCTSVKEQFRQAWVEMQADLAILDSGDDGLAAFGSGDAKYLRAARAEMER